MMLPRAIVIHQTSENCRSFQAHLTRNDWAFEYCGYSQWARFNNWHFFDMRAFAVEQKRGQEKYFSIRGEGSKTFYLFYDADSQSLFGAIE